MCLALVFSPTAPALARDFGPTETFNADSANDTDANPNKINDAGTEITVTGDGTYSYTLSGRLSGSGNLTKTGSGTLVLGNTNNTYTGATIVSGGTLNIAGFTAINPDADNQVSLNVTLGTGDEYSTVIGNRMPDYCSIYYNHEYTNLTDSMPVYVGEPHLGGFWTTRAQYASALKQYNDQLRYRRYGD